MACMHIHSDTVSENTRIPFQRCMHIHSDTCHIIIHIYIQTHAFASLSLPEIHICHIIIHIYIQTHMSHHHTHIHSDTRIRISFYCITSSYTYVTSSYIVHTFYLYTFKHTHSHLFPFQRYAYKNKKTKKKRHCIRIHRNLAQILRTNQTKFEDPTFPADATSLFSDPR